MDLNIIFNESEIRDSYNTLLSKLKNGTDKKVNVNICLPNKTEHRDIHWSKAYSFWWCELPNQKLVFGLFCPEENDYVSTPCYFTVPHVYNSRCGGAFAVDKNKKTYLINKGNFFLIEYDTNKALSSNKIIDEHYTGKTVNIIYGNKTNRAILVCCIENSDFFEQITQFISEIHKIKDVVENPKAINGNVYEAIDQKDINNLRQTKKDLLTIGKALFWSYANLGAVHAALNKGDKKLHRIHYIIRSKLYKGLTDGTMNISSIYKDERQKLKLPRCCCYCGKEHDLSIDHVFSRKKGGNDSGENLVWCCKSCNSSKSSKDLLEWMFNKKEFPSILLLRRYLKLSIQFCKENNLMDWPLDKIEDLPMELPFSINSIPYRFPNLNKLRIWIVNFEGMNTA